MSSERIKVNSNFYLDEFVDPYTYFNYDDHGLQFVDERLFDQAQLLRYLYGKPVYINTWWKYYIEKKDKWDINHIIERIEESRTLRKWSGIRTSRCDIGSRLSAHKLIHTGKGMAIDPKGNELKFYSIIKEHAEVFYKLGLRRLESIKHTPGWLHMDLLERNTIKNSIRVVTPTSFSHYIKF